MASHRHRYHHETRVISHFRLWRKKKNRNAFCLDRFIVCISYFICVIFSFSSFCFQSMYRSSTDTQKQLSLCEPKMLRKYQIWRTNEEKKEHHTTINHKNKEKKSKYPKSSWLLYREVFLNMLPVCDAITPVEVETAHMCVRWICEFA